MKIKYVATGTGSFQSEKYQARDYTVSRLTKLNSTAVPFDTGDNFDYLGLLTGAVVHLYMVEINDCNPL